jgi:hypothetical protein
VNESTVMRMVMKTVLGFASKQIQSKVFFGPSLTIKEEGAGKCAMSEEYTRKRGGVTTPQRPKLLVGTV